MLLVAASVGAVVNRKVVGAIHEHMLIEGMGNNRGVAERTVEAMRKLIDQGLTETDILGRFRYGSRVADAFGYALFLVDAPSRRVVAHSDPRLAQGRPPVTDLLRAVEGFPDRQRPVTWLGAFRAASPTGMPMLVYFEPIDRRWTLGVASDLDGLMSLERMLIERLNQLLMVTAAVIAVLGFLVVRGVGRSYERDLEREVRERARELEAAHADLLHKTRLASIGQTASMLIHELRNPLASMKLGLSDMFAANGLGDTGQRRLNIMLEQVDRLDGLLSQVLDYVRPVRPSAGPMSLDALLDNAILLLEPLFEQRGVRIARERCADCLGLGVDGNLMAQAFINLLKNALEASPDGGCVEVRLGREGRALRLEVANRGPEISAADLARIFEPFVTSKSLGTGLGLPMVKRVVEEHGGTIRVSSDREAGTRFVLSLPVEARGVT
jgi:signal transduction histidine kinase